MATWTAAYIGDLPDSAFACPEERAYPHHDASGKLDLPHLRAALSRVGDPDNTQCGKGHLVAHARTEGMGEFAKSLVPVKAQPLDDDEMTAWFSGRIARRLLAIPFGGPFQKAGAPRGVDLDGEFFDEATDIYGAYPELRRTRERLVDWTHTYRPPTPSHRDAMMEGHTFGKSILDPDPDEDGWWVDLWLEAGNKRLALIQRLVEKGAQLFGSSQAAMGVVVDANGRITVWPYILQTLTTSPQNTLSAFAAKALPDDLALAPDLRRVLDSLDNLSVDLGPTSTVGEDVAKTGRVDVARFERALDDSLEPWRLR